MFDFFTNAMKSYIGDSWKRILVFCAIPFGFLFTGGIIKTVFLVLFVLAYFTMMGMGIYDDIMSGRNVSAINNMVNKVEGKLYGSDKDN